MNNRPDYVKDEHLEFLNGGVIGDPFYYCPFQDALAHKFSIPIEIARKIVDYWFKTLDDDEE